MVLLATLGLAAAGSAARAVHHTLQPFGRIDFHSYWYAGHFVRQGTDPYQAYFAGLQPRLPVAYVDGATATRLPIAEPELATVPHATIVCSGPIVDFRHPEYFRQLMDRVASASLEENFIVLGVVPHAHVLQLIRQSLAVLQPSLFEGWSTSVEEAKSIGKRVLGSDIPVHREHAPWRARYFDPHEPEDLANCLARRASDHQHAGAPRAGGVWHVASGRNYQRRATSHERGLEVTELDSRAPTSKPQALYASRDFPCRRARPGSRARSARAPGIAVAHSILWRDICGDCTRNRSVASGVVTMMGWVSAPCALYPLLEPFPMATGCAIGVFMNSNVAELFQQASALSDADRATLAALLIESLEPEQDANVEAAWAAEVERRVAELDAGAVTTVPWSAVREELQRRLRERS